MIRVRARIFLGTQNTEWKLERNYELARTL